MILENELLEVLNSPSGDGDLLTHLGMDSQKWAEAFCRICDGQIVEGNGLDENAVINSGTMIGWFANAIMAGYDCGFKKGRTNGLVEFLNNFQRTTKNP